MVTKMGRHCMFLRQCHKRERNEKTRNTHTKEIGDYKTNEIPFVICSGFKARLRMCECEWLWCIHSCDRSRAAAFGLTNVAEKEVSNNSNDVLLRSDSSLRRYYFDTNNSLQSKLCGRHEQLLFFSLHATLQHHKCIIIIYYFCFITH